MSTTPKARGLAAVMAILPLVALLAGCGRQRDEPDRGQVSAPAVPTPAVPTPAVAPPAAPPPNPAHTQPAARRASVDAPPVAPISPAELDAQVAEDAAAVGLTTRDGPEDSAGDADAQP